MVAFHYVCRVNLHTFLDRQRFSSSATVARFEEKVRLQRQDTCIESRFAPFWVTFFVCTSSPNFACLRWFSFRKNSYFINSCINCAQLTWVKAYGYVAYTKLWPHRKSNEYYRHENVLVSITKWWWRQMNRTAGTRGFTPWGSVWVSFLRWFSTSRVASDAFHTPPIQRTFFFATSGTPCIRDPR